MDNLSALAFRIVVLGACSIDMQLADDASTNGPRTLAEFEVNWQSLNVVVPKTL